MGSFCNWSGGSINDERNFSAVNWYLGVYSQSTQTKTLDALVRLKKNSVWPEFYKIAAKKHENRMDIRNN